MRSFYTVFAILALIWVGSSCRTTENKSDSKGKIGAVFKNPKVEANVCASTGEPIPGTNYSLQVFPPLDQEWKPCKETEAAEFVEFGAQIRGLQDQLANAAKQNPDYNADFKFRGFHSKSHGCLAGKFKVNNPPFRGTRRAYNGLRRFAGTGEPTAYGLFKQKHKEFEVYVRFSNAQGAFQNDASPDGKGIAIKFMNAGGAQTGSHDWTMSNTPICNARTAKDFMGLGHSLAGSILDKAGNILKPDQRTAVFETLKSAAAFKPSAATEQYWTRTAFKMGPYAAKYSIKPERCGGQTESILKMGAFDTKPGEYKNFQSNKLKTKNYYLEELIARTKKWDICFGIWVQFQTDPAKTPVEDPMVNWTPELSPFVKLGTITLPKSLNRNFNSKENKIFCERLGFSPEFFVREHAPMSHMNRARLAVYEASRVYRQKQYPASREPKSLINLPMK